MLRRAVLLAFCCLIVGTGSAQAHTLDFIIKPTVVWTTDGDRYFEPGEQMRLSIRLINGGDDPGPISNVRAAMQERSDFAATPGGVNWPDLGPGQSAVANSEVTFTPTADHYGCGGIVGFAINIETDQGADGSRGFGLDVGGVGSECRKDNLPPSFSLALVSSPAYVGHPNAVAFRDTRDPDGWMRSVHVTVDGHEVRKDFFNEFDPNGHVPFQWHTPGRRVVRVVMTDNAWGVTTRTINVDVLPKPSPPPPRTPRGGLGPRFAFYLPIHARTAAVNRRGIPVTVECTRACRIEAHLRITAYRARKLGLRRRFRGHKIDIARVDRQSSLFHRFRLVPDRSFRRALRRGRRVPVLVTVTSIDSLGRRRSSQAEVELNGPRPSG